MTINNKYQPAFTLIELLVVIAIIGILTALAVVSLQNSRRSARDTKRLSDVKQIQIALELYYHDNNNYPETLVPGESLASNSITYMETIPYPPTTIDGDCSTTSYTYSTSNDQSYYNIHFCLSSNTGSLPAGEVVASPRGLGVWTCGERLLDERDNQSYATVQIGSQCWMAENINYDLNCSSTVWIYDEVIGYSIDTGWCGCHGNNPVSCDTYGKLYQWSAAMNHNTSTLQGICPNGWHVPSQTEIGEFISFLSSPSNSQYQCGDNYTYISKALASPIYWSSYSEVDECIIGSYQERNNTSGFSALPAGYRGPNNFYSSSCLPSGICSGGYNGIWSSTFATGDRYYLIGIYWNYPYILNNHFPNGTALSVRCLKDN